MTSLYYNNLSSITNMIMLREQEEETNQLYTMLDYDDHQMEYIINHQNNDPFCTVTRFNWTKDKGSEIEWRFYDRTTEDLLDCLVADGIVEDVNNTMFVFKDVMERYLSEHCSSYVEFGCAY